jgi:hypothetical protein
MSGTELSSDDAIQVVISRLSRPHPSGGRVIERAAILAEGERSGAIMDWITAHDGEPELAAPRTPSRGLYSVGRAVTSTSAPARYVLPAGAIRGS